MATTEETPVTLKWSKQTFEVTINSGESALSFKERVQTLTGVPVERQKLLCRGGSCWKGPLKDGAILDTSTIKSLSLTVTLIGSAETLSGPKQKTTFIEDMTAEELQAEEQAQAQAALATAVGMIPALQLPPHRREDGKQEMYAYNRLVTGLPQRQIEQELAAANRNGSQHQGDYYNLQGKVAITLGMELRRAYVNDLAVLTDGTCVSAMDDGHVLLWKHGAQQNDVVHTTGSGSESSGVDSVVALSNRHHPGAFATAGRGFVQVWTMKSDDSVKPAVALPASVPGTTPASLVSIPLAAAAAAAERSSAKTMTCLAARFKVTRQSDPTQFRLPPQNEAERQRRAQAEAQEQAIQQALARAASSVQIWFGSSVHALQSQVLVPPTTIGSSAPVTCLTSLSNSESVESSAVLVVGDASGGLRLWKLHRNNDIGEIEFSQQGFYRLMLTSGSGCSIVCLQSLRHGRLAVSTNELASTSGSLLSGAVPVVVPTAKAVHILDLSQREPSIQTTLTGHANDAVICMCELPNGDLLTGGGRLDATLQLWDKEQVEAHWPDNDGEETRIQTKAHKTLEDVGYVFALAVLPDLKKDSNYFAVAAARYNTVKIIL